MRVPVGPPEESDLPKMEAHVREPAVSARFRAVGALRSFIAASVIGRGGARSGLDRRHRRDRKSVARRIQETSEHLKRSRRMMISPKVFGSIATEP